MDLECKSSDMMSMQLSEPSLCSKGCGFLGTEATKGLCSKCYRDDLTMHEIQTAQARSALEKFVSFPSRLLSVKTKKAVAAAVEAEEDEEKAPLSPKREPKKCKMCNKKMGLTNRFKCHCGRTLCGSHRYPEMHGCWFDFQSQGKIDIAMANPIIKADKLQRCVS